MTTETQKRIAIFDIDGTLADHSHRIHHVSGKKKNFPAYHDLCPLDPPNKEVVDSAKRLAKAGTRIVLMTGRPESHRGVTEKWLEKHGIKYEALHMRPTSDLMKSREMKLDWVNKHYGGIKNVMAVWEDKKDVVDMWVDQKIPYVHALPDLAIEGDKRRLYVSGKEVKLDSTEGA